MLPIIPENESGVVGLFCRYMNRMGFKSCRIISKFPDCIAIRDDGTKLRIEFEYKSRNFWRHGHDWKRCDMIVCWEHDWVECPLPVIEMKKIAKRKNKYVDTRKMKKKKVGPIFRNQCSICGRVLKKRVYIGSRFICKKCQRRIKKWKESDRYQRFLDEDTRSKPILPKFEISEK